MSRDDDLIESPELENIRKGISSQLQRAKKSSEASLEVWKTVGESLKIAKGLVPHKQFAAWVKRHFGHSRQWSSRLTKLADSWEDLGKARLWAQDKGEMLGTKEHSVDGALALIGRMERAQASPEEADKPREKRKTASDWKAEAEDWKHKVEDLRHERDKLRQELATAQDRLEQLKAREWALSQPEKGASLQEIPSEPTSGPDAVPATGHMLVSSSADVQSTGHLHQGTLSG